MADAMVTARMSAEKKREGNLLLKELGFNASQAINQLYDYVLKHKEMPFEDRRTSAKAAKADMHCAAESSADDSPCEKVGEALFPAPPGKA